MRTIAFGLLLAATLVSAEDSPLVALAKRATRAKSKTMVITNETVTHSKGRFSQASGDSTTAAPAPAAAATPVPAPRSQQNPAVLTAPLKTTLPGEVGSGAYGPSTARIIEPQSSARNIEPTGARPTAPAATTVQTIGPTVVAPVTPQSTARNITPTAAPIQGTDKKQQ